MKFNMSLEQCLRKNDINILGEEKKPPFSFHFICSSQWENGHASALSGRFLVEQVFLSTLF